MKTRTLVLVFILIISVMIVSGSYAKSRKTKIETERIRIILTGTWINHDYDEIGIPGKIVYKPNGSYGLFINIDDTQRAYHGQYTYIEAWMTSKDAYWYKATYEDSSSNITHHEFGMIDSTKPVWEFVFSGTELPADWEWNPNDFHVSYRIYYRRE